MLGAQRRQQQADMDTNAFLPSLLSADFIFHFSFKIFPKSEGILGHMEHPEMSMNGFQGRPKVLRIMYKM